MQLAEVVSTRVEGSHAIFKILWPRAVQNWFTPEEFYYFSENAVFSNTRSFSTCW